MSPSHKVIDAEIPVGIIVINSLKFLVRMMILNTGANVAWLRRIITRRKTSRLEEQCLEAQPGTQLQCKS